MGTNRLHLESFIHGPRLKRRGGAGSVYKREHLVSALSHSYLFLAATMTLAFVLALWSLNMFAVSGSTLAFIAFNFFVLSSTVAMLSGSLLMLSSFFALPLIPTALGYLLSRRTLGDLKRNYQT